MKDAFYVLYVFFVSHMLFDIVKEDGVNIPELLHSVYIS